mmetsp:Transcript_159574/g.294268  ORF Transcript_159574/g.294268 Transcript_159574/m.294268 type:complete len:234 (-) Transcript_159574:12-713(-)
MSSWHSIALLPDRSLKSLRGKLTDLSGLRPGNCRWGVGTLEDLTKRSPPTGFRLRIGSGASEVAWGDSLNTRGDADNWGDGGYSSSKRTFRALPCDTSELLLACENHAVSNTPLCSLSCLTLASVASRSARNDCILFCVSCSKPVALLARARSTANSASRRQHSICRLAYSCRARLLGLRGSKSTFSAVSARLTQPVWSRPFPRFWRLPRPFCRGLSRRALSKVSCDRDMAML